LVLITSEEKIMKKVVVYDSQFGNTKTVALAIANSLSIKAVSVTDINVSGIKDLDLLVIGSPTNGGRATEAIQKFISNLPDNEMKNIKVAVFDTRFLESDLKFALKLLIKTIGYAAPKMADMLRKKGATLIRPPEGFIVKGKEGPLADGEIERAKKWLKT
jgi:flavodoxin